jgi:ATP-dependent DNA helicase RecQ
MQKYGQQFVDEIRRQMNLKRKKGDSTLQTLALHDSGMSVDEIAAARGIQRTTVYSHLAQLVGEGRITDTSTLIADYELSSVRTALARLGGATELRPVYDLLEGAVEYGKIRLAMAVIAREQA